MIAYYASLFTIMAYSIHLFEIFGCANIHLFEILYSEIIHLFEIFNCANIHLFEIFCKCNVENLLVVL